MAIKAQQCMLCLDTDVTRYVSGKAAAVLCELLGYSHTISVYHLHSCILAVSRLSVAK